MNAQTRHLILTAAVLSFAACSSPTTTGVPAPTTPSLFSTLGSIEPEHPSSAGDKWPAGKKQLLFVSDLKANKITIYDPTVVDPVPVGKITNGLSRPTGLAVDTAGDLYAVNDKNNTVVEYKQGTTKPYFTIADGLDSPYGIAIDDDNEIFVSNTVNFSIVGYEPDSQTPFETIDFSEIGQPLGLNFDSHGNLWVACDNAAKYTSGGVFEIPAGTTNVEYSGLTGLVAPIGIAFGKNDITYVSTANYPNSFVNIYAYGSGSPKGQITSGIKSPSLNTFTKSGVFFQVNNIAQNVLGYQRGQYTPFSTISGFTIPLGIAAWPRAH
jgi:hypothetical protein